MKTNEISAPILEAGTEETITQYLISTKQATREGLIQDPSREVDLIQDQLRDLILEGLWDQEITTQMNYTETTQMQEPGVDFLINQDSLVRAIIHAKITRIDHGYETMPPKDRMIGTTTTDRNHEATVMIINNKWTSLVRFETFW